MWMVSFGDAMSLLVTFFVMLLSFATFETAQLAELMGALKGGLNALPSVLNEEQLGRRGRSGSHKAALYERNVPREELSKISPYEDLLQKQHSQPSISENSEDEFFMRMLQEGLSLVIKTDTLFVPGTTEFFEHRVRLLGVIVDMGIPVDNELRITSVLPSDAEVLDKRVKTPWGLAAERAAAVQERISAMSAEFPMSRFSIGTRIEEPGDKPPESEGLPSDRMEITFVGYRDIPKVIGAEEPLLKEMLR